MPNTLVVTAESWDATRVPSRFVVMVGDVALASVDAAGQLYEIPAGTTEVLVTAAPTATLYWKTNILLSVSASGTISPGAGFESRVSVAPVPGAQSGVTHASVRVNRFREVTDTVAQLLKEPIPGPRGANAPDAAELQGTYGTWPPPDPESWAVKPAPNAHYLDIATPAGAGALNFAKDNVAVDVDNVVLELAGVAAPRLFGVTWPKAIAPRAGANPTPILLFLRQTSAQDLKNEIFKEKWVKPPYPYNFDYAERCLFESLHYGSTPLFKSIGWTLRPKGVPYQVAKSGAQVVTVYPVAKVYKEYGVLSDMDQTGKILEELQAYMFWRAGVRTPPATLGRTVIAAFSSSNYDLTCWLTGNRTSSFLTNTVSAVYFLDPPAVGPCVTAALKWAGRAGSGKRIRLYSRKLEWEVGGAFRKLLDLKSTDPALGAPPYVKSALNNTRTVAVLDRDSWVKTFKNVLGVNVRLEWWDVHHFIPATVLTHALAQGDF